MSGNRNHWITFVGHTVVGWEAVLPDAEAAIRVGMQLVESGKRHAVWDTSYWPSAADFETHVRTAVRERGQLPILFHGPDGLAATTARLALYRGDELVEETVADVGELLRELRAGRLASIAGSTLAVVVRGFSVPVDHPEQLRISVRLDTDIWFPTVMGFDEVDEREDYDNRALAERHTPRLNAFLHEVATTVTGLGGDWKTLEGSGFGERFYAAQWNAAGIVL
ncbi:MAG: hypothetical protein ABI867_42325, partial [Kofleriaceae bacterium]